MVVIIIIVVNIIYIYIYIYILVLLFDNIVAINMIRVFWQFFRMSDCTRWSALYPGANKPITITQRKL